MECAFHGKEPDEDEDEQEEPEDSEQQKKLRVAPTPQVAAAADQIPVVVQRKTDKVLDARAEVNTPQGLQEEAFGDAIGIPVMPDKLTPGKITTPLYIPDERMFTALGGAPLASAELAEGETAFVEAVATSKSLAVHQEEAFPDVGKAVGQSVLDFEALAWVFIGVFAANALAHAANFYGATKPAAPRIEPRQTLKPGPKNLLPPGTPKPPPVRMIPSQQPVAPPRGGGLYFPSLPGEVDPRNPPVIVQDEWDIILDAAIPSPSAETDTGGQDVD